MEPKQELIIHCLKSLWSHYHFSFGQRPFSSWQVTAICKTLSDHICLIMVSHFYPVFYSSHRATACPVSFDSLNNTIKHVVQVLTALAAFCFSERCYQVEYCIYLLVQRARMEGLLCSRHSEKIEEHTEWSRQSGGESNMASMLMFSRS